MAECDVGVQGSCVGNLLPNPPEPQLHLSPVSRPWQRGPRHLEFGFITSH